MIPSSSQHRMNNKVVEFQAHKDCVSSCQFCFDDAILVTASHDTTIALWDGKDAKRLKELSGHTDNVTDCTVDEQNHRLLSASWDKSVALWDMNSSETKMTWDAKQSSLLVSCDLCSVHQLAVAAADGGHYHVWDVRSGLKINTVKGHSNTIMCCRFDSSGINLCTCSMDHTAIVWDIRMWKYLLKLSYHTNVVSCCAFSHNNHWLLTSSWDKNVHLHNIADGTYRSEGPVVLSQHHGCVSSCVFAKDDSLFVSGGYDCDVNVWSNDTHQLKNTYKGHSNWIKDVHFGNDKNRIVTGDKNGEVRVWNMEAADDVQRKGQPVNTGHDKYVKCCNRCGDKFTLVTIARPHNLQLNNGLCLLCQCRQYVDLEDS